MKSYVLRVELVEEDDGRWSASGPVLPGCATWGHTREEALHNIRDAAEAYIRDIQNTGEEIPKMPPPGPWMSLWWRLPYDPRPPADCALTQHVSAPPDPSP